MAGTNQSNECSPETLPLSGLPADSTPLPFWWSPPKGHLDYQFSLGAFEGPTSEPASEGGRGAPSVLVVAFSGLGQGQGPPNFEFKSALAPYRSTAPQLYLRDSTLQWYVPRRDYFAGVISAARKAVRAERLVFVGVSAGGWAALFFQALFFPEADCLAFSPQAFLDSDTREDEGDVGF